MMRVHKLKAGIIFDLDGTLIDSSKGIVLAVEDTLMDLGQEPLPRDFIISKIGPPIGNAIKEIKHYSEEDLEKFNFVFRSIYGEKYLFCANVYEGIPQLLSDLNEAGYLLGVATNKREDFSVRILDRLNLLKYFRTVCGMDIRGKLNKTEIVNICKQKMTEDGAERIIMIGDASSDMNSAKDCGINFIGVTYGFGFKVRSDVPSEHPVADSPYSLLSEIRKVI